MSQRDETPYPNVLVVKQPEPETWLYRLSKTCGAVAAVIALVAIILNVGRWVEAVDAGHARPPFTSAPAQGERTPDRTPLSPLPALPSAPVEGPSVAARRSLRNEDAGLAPGHAEITIDTPTRDTTVGTEFRVAGTFRGKLRSGEVLAAFVRHGNAYWGKGQIDVDARTGEFDHIVNEGGRNGLFYLEIAALPAPIADEVDRDIQRSHADGNYRAWKARDLGGSEFRRLAQLELLLKH